MAKILLEMKNITKTFPGVKALDNVNLKVEAGRDPRSGRRERSRKIDSDERTLRRVSIWQLHG